MQLLQLKLAELSLQYELELKKFPKDATNMNINIPTEKKVKVS